MSNRHSGKGLYLAFSLALAMMAGQSSAFADMRCSTSLISEGDTSSDVERQCGAPSDRQIIPAAAAPRGEKSNAVTVENWVYGPRNGAYYKLKFIDGKLVSIDVSR
ncbi:DUF2845 domain-containing protein [Pseudomonas sp. ATCC PTA-122608]|uniref:DUF2845 domain-containing protein n=1 Tax=Pseudomonas sp. ATCC PTA-122608 TaxID=1771311 RepID=UPI00096B7F5D|nr:DUF2845 domain-containing protein [Pseudomonas sp. ATCC PTA-122608]